MSASKKKELRSAEREERNNRRAEQLAQKQAEAKKLRRNTTIVVAAFLVLTLVVVLLSTPVLYGLNAVTCGSVRYTTADYNYFYANTYNNYYMTYYNYYGESAQYFMPGEETMRDYAVTAMQEVAALSSAAEEAGFELSEEGKATVEESCARVENAAELQRISARQYLKNAYGAGVTMKVFQRCIEMSLLAEEYESSVQDTFTYTQDELDAHYAENVDNYDVIGFNAYYFNGNAVEDNADTEEDESVDAETAMAEAEAGANEFLDRLNDGEKFAELAFAYSGENEAYAGEKAGYTELAGEKISEIYSEWLLNASRKAGDATVAAADNGYYVVEFVSRNDNRYETVNVRHILIQPDAVSEDVEDYDAAVAAANEMACAVAEEILKTWKAGEATEESFAALADTNSDDTASEGGLYTQVYRGQMVEAFEEWCFDSSRKAGDVDVIETEHGYHVMYFVGTDALYCDVLAENNLRNAAYTTWFDELVADTTVKTNLFYSLYIK